MEHSSKKRRGEWTETQLRSAFQAVKSRQMSQRKAAETYGIPRRTLRNHIESGSMEKITGRVPVLNKSQEKDLCKRIIRLSQIGMPLTPKIVRKQAYEFCKANNVPNVFSDKKNIAGKKWLTKFLKRNPELSLRRAQMLNPARAQKLNKAIVSKHFEALKDIYDELNISIHPERLYNMDEKGCRLTLHHQQKVFAAKGTKRVHFVSQEHAENVTVAMCVSATGNTVPPMILFKGKRLRPEFCDNLPPGSLVKMAPKGSMTTELFVNFIHHLGQNKTSGKCLLIFDGASSHLDARIVDAADVHNIVLYCLPSNTTHELQPLDKSVNKSFEHFWDEEVLLYAYQHPERKLTKARFTKNFSKVWSKCMTKDNIISGFRATGIFPYDPSAIPEEAYAPSVLTLIPDPQLASSSRMPPLVSNSSPSRHSIPVSPVMYQKCNSHSDETFSNHEEEDRNLSPSILIHEDLSPNHANYVKIVESYPHTPSFVKKLVNYSSSFEDFDMDNLENQDPTQKLPVLEKYNRSTEFCSPIPTTSGFNKQPRSIPRLGSSTPDSSENEDFHEGLSTKRFNIYTSSSESDEENLNADRKLPSHPEPSKFQHPEDNLPLSELKKYAEKSPFHKQIPTPNFATIKYKPRRKAMNYIGQKITKDLFDTVKEKTAKNTKRTTKKTKLSRQPSDADTAKNLQLTIIQRQKGKQPSNSNKGKKQINKKKGNKLKKVPRGRRLNEDINKKENKKKDSKTLEKHGWYCNGCKVDRLDDMRQCQKCQKWYHEVCVGLTKDDEEQFICPECN
ncbi:uncharacterized protein LOC120633772 [Pararge aegeria]|uniref:uncharacterized protein LOC120633772 n=1 Tax=Pararge aegeria TaxID=116150 RepID=UPI0019D07217|nr:uncharacterized protein LOC120633772 [Pararge aegeria]